MKTWEKIKNNPNLWSKYFIREKVIKITRNFFDQQNFHEVETPILISNPAAESYLDVFETILLDRKRNPRKMYLSTSPETSLKKLLVAGIGNCYSITKSFRNMETDSNLHNPEFTILEWYRTGVDYKKIMNDCENLVLDIYQNLNQNSGTTITYQGKSIDLKAPWERITINEAFQKYAGINLAKSLELETMAQIAKDKGYIVEDDTSWEELYNQIYLNEIEPNLGIKKPTIIYEFPASVAALAKVKANDHKWAERFEFYIAGLELGDAYTELTDWREQENRFKNEITKIKKIGKTEYDYDHDFIKSLKIGLPDCSGVAVGLDRLIMLMSDTNKIQDTLFFPFEES